ncbi:FAD-binding oxidoreductase [Cetobacterium somerae]|uniref:FAD-dependent oxidoreductase n=1 Tax=Cetobacterium somerae TaxID=188913 RepID=UPI00211E175F|nr:FAD-dependent oxidoreductase [Cetobacterium somerae]MCQ9628112.1 FAD-binding oxidoreductase [Cetobacterium somerae]
MEFDKIIIGAGIYGLYATLFCAKKGEKVLLLEYDQEAVARATYINQARVHNGYHYPRSYSTAIKSAKYFNRFNKDFEFAINKEFLKVYATSKEYSWTDAEQFKKFCKNADIKCEELVTTNYFKKDFCDGVFDTLEYTFDAMIIKEYYINELKKYENVEIKYGVRIEDIKQNKDKYEIYLENDELFETDFLLNATYASTNQITSILGFEKFKIKYEICEIILCKVSDNLKDVGITVMDGPFFSVMPFGKTGYHSLTSVTFTPHVTSYDDLPTFPCQRENVECSPKQLGNCNLCKNKPETAWNYMSSLAKKYLKDDIKLEYSHSLYSVKPILMASEIDDSRPTVIKQFSSNPTYISVLSGKINTIYDLDEVLK